MTNRVVISLFLVLGVSLLAVSIVGSTAVTAAPETVTNCTTIDSSGEYVLGTDIDGSSNATCIKITSSDVILDGDGYSIDDGESDGDIGIHVNGSIDTPLDNVTVRNLSVEGSDVFTTVGIKVGNHTSGTTLEDISVTNWTRGIQFWGDDGRIDTITVDNVFDTDAPIQRRGVVVFGSNNTVTNINSSGERPFQIEGTNNTIADSVADLGPMLVYGDHNTLTNNTGDTTNTGASFAVDGDYNTLSENVMDGTLTDTIENGPNGGTFYGVRIEQGSHNTITDNILTETDESGIYIKNSDNNTLVGNNVTGAYKYGIELDSAPNTTIRDTVADDARVDGIHSSSSSDVGIVNTSVNNVGEEGIWMSGATGSLLDNVTAKDTDRFGNDRSAVKITGTSGIVVRNSTVSNTDSHGIHIITADSPLVEGNTVEDAGTFRDEFGIYIASQGSSAIPGAIIRNNSVIDSSDNGIHLDWGVDAMVTGNDVRNPAGSTDIAGITIRQGSSNVTVANNTLNATANGIELFDTDNSTVRDNHAFDIVTTPLWIQGVNDSTFTRNRLSGGSYTAVAIDGLDNVIYDNYINNSDYVDSRGSGANAWNISKQAGENIVGGPYIGGNYYATPAGDGFSETCTDGDDDGICDSTIAHFSDNVDYLPLATPPEPTVIQINKSGSGDYTTIQQGVNNATEGDTVEVQPGTYTETVTVDTEITLVAPNGATLNGSSFGIDSTGIYVDRNVSTGLTIDGFTVESYGDGISVGASTNEGSDDSYEFDGTAGGWVIQNVVVRDNAQDGIDVAGTTTAAWTIDNVTATSNGDEGLEIGYEVNGVDPNQDWIVSNVNASKNGEYGIRVGYEQGAWTIENTTTNDNGDSSESGVQVYQSGSNWSIADYTATGNDGSGIDVASGDAGLIERANLSENRQFGLEALTEGDWTLRDSLVLNNDEDGVYDSNTASSFLIENVTIRGNGHDGVFLLDNTGDWQILDSVIENNGGSDFADPPGSGIDAERTSGSWVVNNTSITGNDGAGIYAVDGPSPFGDATDNWWGQSSGPTADQCQGNVTCSPSLSSEPGATGGSTQTNTTVSKINVNTSEVFVENALADIGVSIPLNDTDAGNATGVQYDELNVKTTRDATYNLTIETNESVFAPATTLTDKAPLLYANITHPDLTDSDIDQVVFTVSVDTASLPSGMDANNVSVYRYDGHWNELSTTQVGQTGDIYELQAVSPGLSVFAVGVDELTELSAAFDYQPSDPLTGEETTLNASGSTGATEYQWNSTDDPSINVTTTDTEITHSFEEAGEYDVTLTAIDGDGNTDSTTKTIEVTASECFIATASFGTERAEEIDTLRDFRDEVLLEHPAGELMVDLYYDNSPPIADWIAQTEERRWVVRELFVKPLVEIISIGYELVDGVHAVLS